MIKRFCDECQALIKPKEFYYELSMIKCCMGVQKSAVINRTLCSECFKRIIKI